MVGRLKAEPTSCPWWLKAVVSACKEHRRVLGLSTAVWFVSLLDLIKDVR